MLALSKGIDLKQKQVAALTKLIEKHSMTGEQKDQIMDQVMELMTEINDKENLMEVKEENKHKTLELIEVFSQQGAGEKKI